MKLNITIYVVVLVARRNEEFLSRDVSKEKNYS